MGGVVGRGGGRETEDIIRGEPVVRDRAVNELDIDGELWAGGKVAGRYRK